MATARIVRVHNVIAALAQHGVRLEPVSIEDAYEPASQLTIDCGKRSWELMTGREPEDFTP